MSAIRDRLKADDGTAVVEFIFIGVLLLIPILYATLMVMRIEAAALASTQAVREAARAFMMADSRVQGMQQARLATTTALGDQGFSIPDDALRIDCSLRCLDPGTSVHVTLSWAVDLPWLPAPMSERIRGFPISAEQSLTVDTYRDTAA